MRYLYSKLPKDKYLDAMKRKLDNPFLLLDERVTGLVLGPFFAVAHYQPYEWNRRITSECNRAWGFVREAEGELEICFLRGKGLLAPGWFLFWTFFGRLVFFAFEIQYAEPFGWIGWVLSAVFALCACVGTAITSSLTEAGEAGIREINKFLENPEDYYG